MTQPVATPFDFPELDRLAEDPSAALDRLIERFDREGRPRELLDASLLRARVDLGLPAVAPRSLADLPEAVRARYEDRYVEAIRRVGQRLLVAGEIVAAWPYFRMLGEKQPIIEALEAAPASADHPELPALIDVAFQQGAHPSWGLRRILEVYGLCSAITAFEHLPADESIRERSAEDLTRALHDQLRFSLRSEIERRGEAAPSESASVTDLIGERPGLFEDEAYHVDTSHLASVIRMAPLLRDPEVLGLARELACYGERLSERYKYAGEPPFEDLYAGSRRYIDAVLGRDVEGGIGYFAARLRPPAPAGDESGASIPAQVLVRLLDRLGRVESAMEVALEHLAGVPESHLSCPTIAELCLRAGRADRLAVWARSRGDAVQYAAAILTPRPASG